MEEPMKNFSGRQVKRVIRISENNLDRANKVLDRMKKRKGINTITDAIEYGALSKPVSGTGGLKEQVKQVASGTSASKYVELSKPVSGSSGFKQVELTSTPKKIESKAQGTLTQDQVTRIANMKNTKRAYRVMDRMKKRNLED
jgi:predicted ATP-grasp superfamily ATP-dependent carboligase